MKINSRGNNKTKLAFTFIEVLIGLTIFSIIAMSLYSTFFSGTSAWKKSDDLNRLYQEARWSLDTIAKELRNAIILSYKNKYPGFAFFQGTPDNISFLVEDEYDIKKVSYFLEAKENGEDNSGFSLKREQVFLIDSLQPTEQEKSKETFSTLVSEGGIKFSYPYMVSATGEDIEWRDKWQDSNNLPAGVKIELVLQNARNPNSKVSFYKTVFIPMGIIGEAQRAE